MDILKQVQNTIDAYQMLGRGESVLVALSGGSDSATLLSVLCRLREQYGLRIYAAHVNHHLRENAGQDAEFAQELCASFGVECMVHDAQVREYARGQGISEELAGRALRYAFFDAVRRERGIDKIATAHNQNDAAETVLMHLIRGSGLDGLGGIPYVRGAVIRPLLDCSKAEIEAYCKTFQIPYVVDETNFETDYTRNKIRLELIPQIECINPNFIETAARNAKICAQEADLLNRLAEQACGRCAAGRRLDLEAFRREEPCIRRRVLQLFYKNYVGTAQNLEEKHIENMLKLIESQKNGNSIDIGRQTAAWIEYGALVLGKKERRAAFAYQLEPGVLTHIPEIGASVRVSACDAAAEGVFCFSADEERGIWLRSRRDGDGFYPVGMTGRKKLSDFFIDQKIPRKEREKIPLLAYGDELVWVVDHRRDRRFLPCLDKKFTSAVEIFRDL